MSKCYNILYFYTVFIFTITAPGADLGTNPDSRSDNFEEVSFSDDIQILFNEHCFQWLQSGTKSRTGRSLEFYALE